MADYCGNCAHFDKSQKEYWGDRYYCTETCKYKDASEKACYSYVKKLEGGYQPSGCFITTIICEILGYEDNCELLQTLRFIRDNYLKKNTAGRALLQEYDIIGPVISSELAKCPTIDAIVLAHKYILPCYDLIKQNRYDNAVEVYTNMVNELKNRFSYALSDAHLDYTIKTPEEDLGKARIRLKPASI